MSDGQRNCVTVVSCKTEPPKLKKIDLVPARAHAHPGLDVQAAINWVKDFENMDIVSRSIKHI